jgi:putative ABC transport system permease protein
MKRTFRGGDYHPDPGRDFGEEARFHLDMKIDELMSEGMAREEAERQALRQFGDFRRIEESATREEARRQRGVRMMDRLDSLRQDLSYGFRTLSRSPGLTLLTVLILAVGIGANTAIFSVLKAVFIQPLPFPQPEELTFVWNRNIQSGGRGPSSFPNFRDWREQNQTFESMGAFGGMNLNLTGGDEPIRIRAAHVTFEVFDVLGIPPAMGRTFLPEEDLSGRRVVVLSHRLWSERFGADPTIIGRSIQIDGGGYTVVGVMPEGFEQPTPWGLTDPYLAWIPILDERPWIDNRNSNSYQILARMRDGVTVERAQADLSEIGNRLEEQYPDTNENQRAWVVPLHRLLYGDAGSMVFLVLLATGAVLLIACGNIAGFLLARATNRRTEMAVRASLGAGRRRIVRQLLTESVLLSLVGGIVAVALAFGSLGGLKALIPPTLPRTADIAIDSGVLLFALITSAVTGVVFGLAPALAASRTQLTDALKEGGRSGGRGRRRFRTQNAFVVAQVATSLALANAGLLLVQSYSSLRDVEQGFDREHTLTMALSLGGEKYDEPEEREVFLDQVHDRLGAIPGVRSAGATSKLPLRGGTNGPTITEARYNEDPTTPGILTEITSIRGDYFESMGIPLRIGRILGPQDADTVDRRVVINEAAASRFWPDQDPIGKRFGFDGDPPDWLTVVGVVGNVRQWGPGSAPRPELYSDYRLNARARMFVTLNAVGDPQDLVRQAREAVLAVDPLQPVSEIQTMGELVESDLSGRGFYTLLVAVFSALAILLAAAGVYGLISYFVVQRTHELGIRLALGAARLGLVAMVLKRALLIIVWGILFGMAAIWVSTRLISSLLFGVAPLDTATIVAGVGLMVLVAAVAALLPGIRGTRLSPVQALRSD